ncbi:MULTISPECIES: NADPH:quinone reductase [unclassified Neorhizobium]|uniref:NADPH:quinone reductase n=1 Tax=unclassified Neorhizobium TaxID=2629175 RepID=UPI001FF66C3E|nr:MULTISPECIES: NADPH:quinone reductase [unclassified Neorhizobium]MCJ9669730.1 NADPH:quinone reductase [Neorhizobium sp. SHOUNA12B]MCJ9746068.1 NADPH:quinone reductase [Neorhizobium sp. SHOUNA12A]
MLAAYYDRQGTADDVLVVGELADPEPGFGEVRVKVAISGVNPTDIKARTGFAGAPMAFPRIVPHHDGAGTIDKIGPGVPEARLGERVWLYRAQYGRPYGTAAEFVVLPSNLAVRLPDNTSFETGACLGVAAITAHRCLFADGDVRGRRVLVQGGGGAVGTASILLAKWAGAWVAATVSRPEQEKVALDAGADLIINRHSEHVAAAIRNATGDAGVDRIVDVDLANNVDVDIACLAPGGVVTAYATEDPTAKLTMPFRTAMFGSYVFRFVFFTTIPDAAFQLAVKEVTACVAAGRYRPHIGLEVPMQHIAQAHAAQESGKIVGKILVRVGD